VSDRDAVGSARDGIFRRGPICRNLPYPRPIKQLFCANIAVEHFRKFSEIAVASYIDHPGPAIHDCPCAAVLNVHDSSRGPRPRGRAPANSRFLAPATTIFLAGLQNEMARVPVRRRGTELTGEALPPKRERGGLWAEKSTYWARPGGKRTTVEGVHFKPSVKVRETTAGFELIIVVNR